MLCTFHPNVQLSNGPSVSRHQTIAFEAVQSDQGCVVLRPILDDAVRAQLHRQYFEQLKGIGQTTAMHELFIVAIVPEKKVKGMLMILQGLCAMMPTRQLEWRFVFEGPKSAPLHGIGSNQIQTRKPANLLLWKELHDQLVRQSYYLPVIYNVDESMFGRDPAAGGEDPAEER